MSQSARSPAPAMAGEQNLKPLRGVLETLAVELEQLRCLGLRVESAICQIAVRAAIDPAVIGELQQLDLVLQQLGNLRAYVGRVAQECEAMGPVCIADALDQVSLAELRTRLAGLAEDDLSNEDGWEIL